MSYFDRSTLGQPAALRIDMPAVMRQVYLWMTLALLATAVTAFVVGTLTSIPLLLARNPLLLIGALVVEIGLVLFISTRIMKLDPATAIALFMGYAILNGITLSFIFVYYKLGTITYAAGASAAMFGATSLFAYTTKIDLSRLGGILLTALIGLIAASVINFFVASDALFWVINYAGVLIFVALTAYHTQRIKALALNISVNARSTETALVTRVGIMGALSLYLDFINLFLFMLRIMNGGRGGRR